MSSPLAGPRLGRSSLPLADSGDLGPEVSELRFVGLSIRSSSEAVAVERCLFTDCDLSGLRARRSQLRDLSLERCRLVNTQWAEGGLSRSRFVGCQMSGFSANATSLWDVTFADCQLQMGSFRLLGKSRVRFSNCLMAGVDFQGSDLRLCTFEDCTLKSARFHQAHLEGVDLRTCSLDDLEGIDALRGAIITTEQLIGLAHALAERTQIVVRDRPGPPDVRAPGPAFGDREAG